jgi:hypothetical protein
VPVDILGPDFGGMGGVQVLEIIWARIFSRVDYFISIERGYEPLKGIPTESEALKKSWARALIVPPLLMAIGPSYP